MCKRAPVPQDWLCKSLPVKRRVEEESASVAGVLRAHSFHLLPGDHGAGLGLVGRNGGGAELREAAVAGLQAGHGTPEVGDMTSEVCEAKGHTAKLTPHHTSSRPGCRRTHAKVLLSDRYLNEALHFLHLF